MIPLALRALALVAVGLPGAGQDADDASGGGPGPMRSDVREGAPWYRAGEECIYRGADGVRTSVRLVAGSDGVALALLRRVVDATDEESDETSDAEPPGVAEGALVRIDPEHPFILREGAETVLAPDAERSWRYVPPDAEEGATDRWTQFTRVTDAEGSTERDTPLPRPPLLELQLLVAFRAVAWDLGIEFGLPLVWEADEGTARVLRPSHVLCTGRETREFGGTSRTAWRIVVEAQGRDAVLRTVYWIDAEAPYACIRHERNDGSTHDLVRRTVPTGPTTPEEDPPGADPPEPPTGNPTGPDDDRSDEENR